MDTHDELARDGWIQDHFRDANGFDVDEYLRERKRKAHECMGVPDEPEQEGLDPEIRRILNLCDWEEGPVDPDQFPCITALSPAPWSYASGGEEQNLRTRFLSSIESLADIRKLVNKNWISERDAHDAFILLSQRDHTVYDQVNQSDADIFGILDESIDMNQLMRSGIATSIFEGTKLPPGVMRFEPNPDGMTVNSVQNHDVVLQTDDENVFPPSKTGMFIANNIRAEEGESCFDVGVGSGIQGIVMAQQGGTVKGSETNEVATEYGNENAKRNGVGDKFTVTNGEFFAGADEDEQFDVIVANLPQTPGDPGGEHDFAEAISAGPEGISILEEFLEVVIKENRLKPGGRLYVLGASIANSARLRELISNRFTYKKVAEQYIRIPEYVAADNIEYLNQLAHDGANDVLFLGGDHPELHSKDTLLELKLAA